MSRSCKHTSICGITKARSEKADKVRGHKRLRRLVNSRMQPHIKWCRIKWQCDTAHELTDSLLPDRREVDNVYDHAKDGKQVFDPGKYPKGMRK